VAGQFEDRLGPSAASVSKLADPLKRNLISNSTEGEAMLPVDVHQPPELALSLNDLETVESGLRDALRLCDEILRE
jgi:hypothetical protein